MSIQSARIAYAVNRAERAQRDAKEKFVKACNDMARNLTEAAQRAEAGLYISETVMSNSLVQDIPKLAVEYRTAGETLSALRDLVDDSVGQDEDTSEEWMASKPKAVGYVVRLHDEDGYSYYVKVGGWVDNKSEATVYPTEAAAIQTADKARAAHKRNRREGAIVVRPTMAPVARTVDSDIAEDR